MAQRAVDHDRAIIRAALSQMRAKIDYFRGVLLECGGDRIDPSSLDAEDRATFDELTSLVALADKALAAMERSHA